MRTLFLLSILITLVVIAIKKPDQTFWEGAQELWGKTGDVVSEVSDEPSLPSLTGNAREDFAALLKRIRRGLEIEKGSGDLVDGEPLAVGRKGERERDGSATNPVLSSPTVSPKTKPKPTTIRKAEAPASWSGGKEIFPAPQEEDLPELPAIPVMPVEVGKIEDSPPPLSHSRLRLSDSQDYGEIKAYYENASRLLAEIK